MRTPRTAGAVIWSVDPDGRVATIVISRGAQLHTLPPQLLVELERILHLVSASAQVVILRTGGKTTGAGVAQAFPQPAAMAQGNRWMPLGHRVFDHITQLPQPTIAVVDGLAIGVGADLALACDHRVANDSARVGPCEVGLGTIPGWSGTQHLAQLVGTERANEILHSTPHLDARTALAWGLLTSVTTTAGFEHHLDRLAHSLLGPDLSMPGDRAVP